MVSVAGGWFFLMACEMFVLGTRDFRLPGLGSYLQTAASVDNVPAMIYGVADDDRDHRRYGPADLAAGDRVERQVQDSSSRTARTGSIRRYCISCRTRMRC